MKYNFKCICGNKATIKCSMNDISKKHVICDKCGKLMNREWSSNLRVPDYMKAEESQEMEWISDRMKNKPSGRRKVIF